MAKKSGRLVWLDIELKKGTGFVIASPSGVAVSLSFKNSKGLEVGTNNNTFRALRELYGSGKFMKFYGNKARAQFTIPEMTEIKQHSKIIK